MRPYACVVVAVLSITGLSAQNSSRSDYISRVIDDAVTAASLPSGYGALVIGYRDDSVTIYKTYGQATVDGTVPLNENTLFGVGSLTKLFTATLVGVASNRGLSLDTPAATLLPVDVPLPSSANRYNVTLLNLADHHAGLPKNEGHLFTSVNDLYRNYVADPITCSSSTSELIHDCGCCDPVYMSLLGLKPSCGTGLANPVYACSTHIPTNGADGWVYSNLGFEVLGNEVATWMGYPDWNQANAKIITEPLGMADTVPLESFTADQVARAAKHCNPATRTTNVNCQLLDWLPVGNPAGGLFSTASDLLKFMSFNAWSSADPALAELAAALPVVHQTYESSPTGGQELAWQTSTLATGELERWKDGSNGPFNSWAAYSPAPLRRTIVLLDSSGSLNVDLSKIGYQVLLKSGPSITTGGIPGDVNGDGVVDCDDIMLVKASLGKSTGQPRRRRKWRWNS